MSLYEKRWNYFVKSWNDELINLVYFYLYIFVFMYSTFISYDFFFHPYLLFDLRVLNNMNNFCLRISKKKKKMHICVTSAHWINMFLLV